MHWPSINGHITTYHGGIIGWATLKLFVCSLQDVLRSMGSLNSDGGMRRFGSATLSGVPAPSASMQHGSYGSLSADAEAIQMGANMDELNGLRRFQSYGSGLLGGGAQHGSGSGLSQWAPQGPFTTAAPQMQFSNGKLSNFHILACWA